MSDYLTDGCGNSSPILDISVGPKPIPVCRHSAT